MTLLQSKCHGAFGSALPLLIHLWSQLQWTGSFLLFMVCGIALLHAKTPETLDFPDWKDHVDLNANWNPQLLRGEITIEINLTGVRGTTFLLSHDTYFPSTARIEIFHNAPWPSGSSCQVDSLAILNEHTLEIQYLLHAASLCPDELLVISLTIEGINAASFVNANFHLTDGIVMIENLDCTRMGGPTFPEPNSVGWIPLSRKILASPFDPRTFHWLRQDGETQPAKVLRKAGFAWVSVQGLPHGFNYLIDPSHGLILKIFIVAHN